MTVMVTQIRQVYVRVTLRQTMEVITSFAITIGRGLLRKENVLRLGITL